MFLPQYSSVIIGPYHNLEVESQEEVEEEELLEHPHQNQAVAETQEA